MRRMPAIIKSIMKNTFKIIVSLAGLMLLAAPGLRAEEPAAPAAEPPKHKGEPGGPRAKLEQAVKELNLSPEQEARWKEIGKQERAVAEGIRNDPALSQDEKRAKMREANKPFADQRRSLLNPEQQQKFDDFRAKAREQGKGGPKPPKKSS
jgi:Spy/CpxP family protein refolding chaperone